MTYDAAAVVFVGVPVAGVSSYWCVLMWQRHNDTRERLLPAHALRCYIAACQPMRALPIPLSNSPCYLLLPAYYYAAILLIASTTCLLLCLPTIVYTAATHTMPCLCMLLQCNVLLLCFPCILTTICHAYSQQLTMSLLHVIIPHVCHTDSWLCVPCLPHYYSLAGRMTDREQLDRMGSV